MEPDDFKYIMARDILKSMIQTKGKTEGQALLEIRTNCTSKRVIKHLAFTHLKEYICENTTTNFNVQIDMESGKESI